MELSYEQVTQWFDAYFEAVGRNQGPLETVPKLRKYFTDDFEFWMYTGRASMKRPLSRDALLMLFVHPGLHEALVPQHYVIDLTKMVTVVQFEIRFVDALSETAWPPKQASAHYHLTFENEDLKIKKIQYWTESFPPEEFAAMYAKWDEYRQEALAELATNYINGKF